MQRSSTASSRPRSGVNRAKPMPLIAKGLGGGSTSIAPKAGRPQSRPARSNVFKSQK